ncbi:Protein of unknown function [Gryllus bimaculatus]|nr:Protein of unknown function [Gryllus bimaculatus]
MCGGPLAVGWRRVAEKDESIGGILPADRLAFLATFLLFLLSIDEGFTSHLNDSVSYTSTKHVSLECWVYSPST